ncbi:GRAM-domain-containing protein [Lichtheimia hyalospora FSU 10163]|nr:GRAM-domain-containing protein [Lichtheimia hyalospora FSU 10163]
MLSQSSPIPDEDSNKLLSPSFYNINTGPGPTCASTSTPILSRQLQGTSRSRRSSASTTCGITPPDSPQKSVSSVSKKKRQKSPDDPASAKRNAEFHTMFRSIPEDDLLMDDYGCALQKEILVQGRMYVSKRHICFNANIFGWVTNLVIDFADIIDIEKRTTAIFIPNAIQISTHQTKYFFGSFLSRDQAFDQLKALWQEVRKRSQSTDSGDSTTTKVDDEYDDGLLTDDTLSTLSGGYSMDGDALPPPPTLVSPLDKPSDICHRPYDRQKSLATITAATTHRPHPSLDRRRTASESQLSARKNVQQNQRSDTTVCSCDTNGGHYTHTVMDQMYSSSIETIYGILANRAFLQKFLSETEKNTDVQVGPWEKGDGGVSGHFSRDISYIKSLNNSIGPRSTKCLLKEQVKHLDLENSVTQVITTQTPDVPSGGSFVVKTRLCIMWAGQGKVRVLVTVLVEFTKSSWLKSTIEKATIDGQTNYYKSLDIAIRGYLQPTPPSAPPLSTKQQRRQRRQQRNQETDHRGSSSGQTTKDTKSTTWLDTVIQMLQQYQLPSMQHLTVLCMFLLVFINLFIASKMGHVTQQLENDVVANCKTPDAFNNNQQYQQRFLELERMIRQAGNSIDQVSKAVEEQQRIMVQRNWPSI